MPRRDTTLVRECGNPKRAAYAGNLVGQPPFCATPNGPV